MLGVLLIPANREIQNSAWKPNSRPNYSPTLSPDSKSDVTDKMKALLLVSDGRKILENIATLGVKSSISSH